VRGDLSGGQASRGQRQHDLVDPVEAALALAHDHGVEAGVSVARDLDLDWPDLGEHGLGAGAVARVPAATPGRIVAVIAKVLAHLRFQSGLEHRLGQSGEQPARADELDALGVNGQLEVPVGGQ